MHSCLVTGCSTAPQLLPFLCWLLSCTWSLWNHLDGICTTRGLREPGWGGPILNFIFTVCSSPLSSTSKISRKMCHWCLWPCLSTSSTFRGHCEDLLTTLSAVLPFPLWWSSEGAWRTGNPRNGCQHPHLSSTLISINKFLLLPHPHHLSWAEGYKPL